jgi:hypothetical protein
MHDHNNVTDCMTWATSFFLFHNVRCTFKNWVLHSCISMTRPLIYRSIKTFGKIKPNTNSLYLSFHKSVIMYVFKLTISIPIVSVKSYMCALKTIIHRATDSSILTILCSKSLCYIMLIVVQSLLILTLNKK